MRTVLEFRELLRAWPVADMGYWARGCQSKYNGLLIYLCINVIDDGDGVGVSAHGLHWSIDSVIFVIDFLMMCVCIVIGRMNKWRPLTSDGCTTSVIMHQSPAAIASIADRICHLQLLTARHTSNQVQLTTSNYT